MEHFQALSPFQPSNLADAIRPRSEEHHGEKPEYLFGELMTIPHASVARIIAVLGFDFIFVDTLHTALNPETLVDIIHTINFVSQGKTCAVVRIPSPESDFLAYALDAGAAGIVFPQIETAAQARAAVNKVRYAYAGGSRSVSPVALLNNITNFAPEGYTAETLADRNIAIICQIESVLGIENIDEIAATPGINCLMLGAGDLRASLGIHHRVPPGQQEHPDFLDAVAKIIAAGKSHNLALLAPAFRVDSSTAGWLKEFKLLVTGADTLALTKAHQQDLAYVKGIMLGNRKDSVTNGN